ncbi:PIN domain-containing protein [Methanolobus psychrotolerans]|uniref:PIN domain-containing protein n=1 Tax=Methanolobus psychrotolerans TaxID=1874706 RepID=UPI000B91A8D8|nr:PIN domain-containing protein [Methanolobus psychrotolerans]
MKILYDTNILIHIEDPKELTPDLQALLTIIREHGHLEFIHPASLKDIENDSDVKRREITLSKLRGYPRLPSPPKPNDDFISVVGTPVNSHDENDNEILFSLKRNLVDFLITEDRGIRRKANLLNLDDRVFSIDSALDYFNALYQRFFPSHSLLRKCYTHEIDIEKPFFDSLKSDYGDMAFKKWYDKCIKESRECYTYEVDSEVKAFLMLKEEDEPIETHSLIPAGKRVKIATLKADLAGSKMGELFLKIAFQYCITNQIFEIYLTHFETENDVLIYLIESFGFEKVGELAKNNEPVYLKKFIPEVTELSALEVTRKYYPSFKDGESVRKFVIPILPKFHDILFPDYKKRQMKLTDYFEINIPGNAIKKAYLSSSRITSLKKGDIILFYRSHDQKVISSLGIIDQDPVRINNLDELKRIVGKRTVYSEEELQEWADKTVFVIRFMHNLYLPNPLSLDYLMKNNILKAAPQSITEINHEQYLALKAGGKLDERFTVN